MTRLGLLFAFATILASAPARAEDPELMLKLMREAGPLNPRTAGGRTEFPMNLGILAMDIATNASVMKPNASWKTITQLAHQDPGALTEAHFQQAGFGWLFGADQRRATMNTDKDPTGYLHGVVLTWRTLFSLEGDRVIRRGFAHPEVTKLDHDVYSSQLPGMLGLKSGAGAAKKGTPRTPRGPATRAPKR
jgi:hypothetical protein